MRLRPTALVLCLALTPIVAGCGDEDDPGPPSLRAAPATTPQGDQTLPRQPAPKLKPLSERVASELDRGLVGVVDLDGRAAIRPERLNFASDAQLEDIAWSRWDSDEAEGSGRVRLLDCDPTCAQGKAVEFKATVRLVQPKACQEGQFYDRVEVRLERTDGGPSEPASFVRAPC
jgi:hypothetical protein